MLKNNKNAFAGRNVEALFKNSIADNQSVVQKIKTYFNLSGDLDVAMMSGIHGEKADVKLGFTCGHNIDVNIKAYKHSSGFNQLTRASINRFCDVFKINDDDREKLRQIVLNKSKDTSSDLFPESEREYWSSFFGFRVNDLIKWGFSFKPSREILVLFDRDEFLFRIYPMKDILKNLYDNPLKFTKGGFNIGETISFQRKGGNGSLSKTIPKTSLTHPGNDVQLKLKILPFIKDMEKYLLAKYSV